MARNMLTDRPGAIVSLEMSAEEIGERWSAALGRIPLGAIRNGALDDSKQGRFEEALGAMAERRLFVFDQPGASLADIRSIARKLRRVEGIEFLVLDYVGLIRQTTRSQSRFDFIGECSRAMKVLARELSIPVILLTQLNRLAEGQRPSLAHIRESGSLEQDSDKILLLHREREVPAGVNLIETELILAKNRAGKTGTIPLVFRADSTSFHEQVLYQEANKS
jgi:replicative DNA helicase